MNSLVHQRIRGHFRIMNWLLLATLCCPHVVLGQIISPEIKPYVEFIKKCNTSPVDYIMELFEKYDVVVLGERDHRDTTQYILIQQIISDPRFIDKVGNVLTEIGVYNMRDELNRVLHEDYQSNSDFDKELAEVLFNIQWIPLYENTNYTQFFTDVYLINKKLSFQKKISIYPTDVQYSWEENKTITNKEFKPFLNVLKHRDLIMGNNAVDALHKIFASPRKKALIIYNAFHSSKFYKNNHDDNFFAYQVIADRFPGRVVNVALNWAIAKYNRPYTGLTNGGKWDAAFAACDNKSVGFDLSGTIFGDDIFDLMNEFTDEHAYKDVYHGFIFYKPASEWTFSLGNPIFRNLDKSYIKDEWARRIQVFQGIPNISEEYKEGLYNQTTTLRYLKAFEGEKLQLINKQIELYYKP